MKYFQELTLYFIVNHNDDFLRGNVTDCGGMSHSQVNMRFDSDINKARSYTTLGGPRGVVTRLKQIQPTYPTLRILKYSASFQEELNEEQRVSDSLNKAKLTHSRSILRMYETQILAITGESIRHKEKLEELSSKIKNIKEEINQLEK